MSFFRKKYVHKIGLASRSFRKKKGIKIGGGGKKPEPKKGAACLCLRNPRKRISSIAAASKKEEQNWGTGGERFLHREKKGTASYRGKISHQRQPLIHYRERGHSIGGGVSLIRGKKKSPPQSSGRTKLGEGFWGATGGVVSVGGGGGWGGGTPAFLQKKIREGEGPQSSFETN